MSLFRTFMTTFTGAMKFGRDASHTLLEEDGTLQAIGSATCWEDDNIDTTIIRSFGNAPDLIPFNGTGLNVPAFSPTTIEELQTIRELPHRRESGSDISFHGHFYPTTTEIAVVRWGLEYFFADMSGAEITTTTTIYANIGTLGTAWARQNFAFADIISPPDFAQFHFRFFRDATATEDTYSSDVATATIGYHYKVDMMGSREITTK